MQCVTLKHGCKINLFLKIGERLPNGYHELESMFLPVPVPQDALHVTHVPGTGIRTEFVCPFRGSASDVDPENNSLIRAHAWYAERTGHSPGLKIRIEKAIPTGGGLGGGSANAAALLLFLQKTAAAAGRSPLQPDDLLGVATELGADIPFFLLGKAAHVSGIGEKLTPTQNPLAGKHLLLVCPDVSVSTAWAYAQLDEHRRRSGKSSTPPAGETQNIFLTKRGRQATNTPLDGWMQWGNDFEEIVFARHPELAVLKNALLDLGAETARMSGAGSCLFALFRNEARLQNAAEKLANAKANVYSARM